MTVWRWGVGALGLSLGLMTGAAQADPLRFYFDIGFGSGPVAGQTGHGWFDIDGADCVADVCSGQFAPADAAHTLLAFGFVVDGVSFTLTDDFGYPSFPTVGLQSNTITGIDFLTPVGAPALSISAHSFSGSLTVFGSYTDINFDASAMSSIAQVPELPTSLLMAAGLLAALRAARRRARG